MSRRMVRAVVALHAAAAIVVAVALAAPSPAHGAAPTKLHTGPAGMQLIEHFEGYFSVPYTDPVGVRTSCFGATGSQIALVTYPASRSTCRWLLRRSLADRYEEPVRRLFRVGGPLRGMHNRYRFDALVSFAYNLGPGAVTTAFPSMWSALSSRSIPRIAQAMQLYVNGGGRVLPGLVRRRGAEADLLRRIPVAFEDWMVRERRWVRLYDRLKVERRKPAKRRELRALMRRHTARIAASARAEQDGWMTRRRRTRYDALARRAR